MAIIFSDNLIVQIFNENKKIKHYSHISRFKKIKDHDGPNDYSVLWNQLLISWQKNIIIDSESLKRSFNEDLIKALSPKIIQELDNIIYKFLYNEQKAISLYYDTFRLLNTNEVIKRLFKLKEIIENL